MANLKFILRPDKMRSDGTVPIFLRITGNGETGYLSTKLYVKPQQWDADKQRVKKDGLYNKRLDDFRRDVEKFNGYNKSYRDIKTALLGNGGNDFIEYANGVIESLHIEGKYWAAENARFALEKLKAFDGKKTIPFKTITPEYVRRFDNYLRQKLGNKQNTVTKNLGSLKRIFRQAERERKIKRDENPFHDYTLSKERVEKQKLSIEEIQKIESLELPTGSVIWNTRNVFLFSFYTGGTRFIDICYLKWDNIIEGRLSYKMSKTSVRSNVKLLPSALDILEYYEPREPGRFIFPLLPDEIEKQDIKTQKKAVAAKNALCNKYLKKIRKLAEIDAHISMHIARHAFADFWRKSGGSLYSLQKMLRHSNISITEQYLKSFDVESIDEEMDGVFSKLKKDKTLKLVK